VTIFLTLDKPWLRLKFFLAKDVLTDFDHFKSLIFDKHVSSSLAESAPTKTYRFVFFRVSEVVFFKVKVAALTLNGPYNNRRIVFFNDQFKFGHHSPP